MSFATVSDYEAKYGEVADAERLQVWLDDVTTYLTKLLGNRYDATDEAQAAALRVVCRDCTHRAFESNAPGFGVSNYSQSANGFTESMTYANATGDIYVTKNERKMLGIGGMSAGYLKPTLAAAVREDG